MRFLTLLAVGLLASCKGEKPAPQTQWVATESLRPGPVRGGLTPSQIERIGKLQKTFVDVDPTPLAKWIEDFSRDADPDREIRIYEGMAEAYAAYCAGRNLTAEGRSDVYSVVLVRSGAPDSEVLANVKLKTLSLDDAREILRLYPAPPEPITVTPTLPNK